ncbi:MAG: YgiT-type zinc finger protein [Methanomicrobia archaeon]|nr:YgiT-type zinc finger protein [Methanomicrobia archaeon]
MNEIKCRCGGDTHLKLQDECSKGVLIKDVPLLVCERCGEEWYPPGIPRMIEGIREATKSVNQIIISAERVSLTA